jgi:hypothetical protein
MKSLIAFLLLAPAAVPAEQQPAPAGATPLVLAKGMRAELCGQMACPAVSVQCDDTAVVRVESSDKGPVLVGVAQGRTLCGALDPNYQRRLFDVTVK